MGRLVSSVFFLLAFLSMQAKSISDTDAKKIAFDFRCGQQTRSGVSGSSAMVSRCKAIKSDINEQAIAYLINYGDNDGFVIVAGDDCVNPILGYSSTGSIEENNMPQNMKGWLQTITSEIDAIKKGNGVAVRSASSSSEGEVVVDALVKTKWYQLEPYNDMIPAGCLTGCVATAMAQIMYYNKWPEQGVGSNSYTSFKKAESIFGEDEVNQISVDFSQSKYDWDNMQLTYADKNWNETQANAVALLMRDCGAAVNMKYGQTVSLSTEIDACYGGNKFFNYSTEVFYHSDYSTEEFEQLIKLELDNSRPVLFTGQSSTSGGSGHAFVVDGYRSDGYFHINWGWNGLYDGFFSLCLMSTSKGSYPAMQAIATFSPNKETTGSTFSRPLRMLDLKEGGLNCGITLDSDFEGAKSSSLSINLKGLYSPSCREYKGQIGLGLYDDKDNLLKELIWNDVQLIDSLSLKDTVLTVRENELANISDGSYTIQAISKELVGEEYMPIRKIVVGGQHKKLDMVVSGSSMKISNVKIENASVSLVNPVSLPEKMALFTNYSLSLSLKNNSDVPQEGHINIHMKNVSNENKICDINSQSFVLYDRQQIEQPINIGLNLKDVVVGDYIARISFLGSKGDTIRVDGLGEDIPVSFYIDEAKVPKFRIDSVFVRVADDEAETNVRDCDPSDIEIDLAKWDAEMTVTLYCGYEGEVWQSTEIRIGDLYCIRGIANNQSKISCDIPFMTILLPIGEYDIPIEYKNVVTDEWVTMEGSPSYLHLRVIDSSTGIDSIKADERQTTKYYDINGRRLTKPSKGLNIVLSSDGKVSKKVIK